MRMSKIGALCLVILGLGAWKCEDKKSEEAVVVPAPEGAAALTQPSDAAAATTPAATDTQVQPAAAGVTPVDVAPTDGYTGEEPVPADAGAPPPADAPAPHK